MRRAKSRAARKASGRLGSNLPVSMVLMVCRDTSRASANWACVQSRSARSSVTGSYLTRGRLQGRLPLAGEGYHFAFGLPDSYGSNPPTSQCDGRCARAGRGFHPPASDLQSVRASAKPAVVKSGWSSALDIGLRRSPRSRGAPVLTGSHGPIIDHQNVDATKTRQQTAKAAISTRHRQVAK